VDEELSIRSRYLAASERIVLEVHRHVIVLVRPFLGAIGVTVAAAAIGTVTSPGENNHPIDTAVGLVAVFFVLRFFWKGLAWWHDHIVLTDQRVFEVSGLVTRRVASMPLSKLTDLTYERSVTGRVLGYGHLIVETAGQHQALGKVAYLPHPDDFYRTVTSLVSARDAPRGDDSESPYDIERDDTGPLPRVII
jgi:Bacterial PH domain